jgi:hypothetical protein
MRHPVSVLFPTRLYGVLARPRFLFSALPRKLVFLHHLGRTFRGLIVVSNITTRLAQLYSITPAQQWDGRRACAALHGTPCCRSPQGNAWLRVVSLNPCPNQSDVWWLRTTATLTLIIRWKQGWFFSPTFQSPFLSDVPLFFWGSFYVSFLTICVAVSRPVSGGGDDWSTTQSTQRTCSTRWFGTTLSYLPNACMVIDSFVADGAPVCLRLESGEKTFFFLVNVA